MQEECLSYQQPYTLRDSYHKLVTAKNQTRSCLDVAVLYDLPLWLTEKNFHDLHESQHFAVSP